MKIKKASNGTKSSDTVTAIFIYCLIQNIRRAASGKSELQGPLFAAATREAGGLMGKQI